MSHDTRFARMTWLLRSVDDGAARDDRVGHWVIAAAQRPSHFVIEGQA